MDKKYQVFVSSTYLDLKDERNAVSKSILDLEHIPSGMELFPAFDLEQLTYIKKVIDQCDYYVLIVAGKYGSVDEQGVSYTEREYDYAKATGKTVLGFIRNKPERPMADEIETDPVRIAALEAFVSKVQAGRLVRFWSNKDDLAAAVITSLVKAFQEMPQTGWVRGNAIASMEALQQLNDLRVQIRNLEKENSTLVAQSKPSIIGLVQLDGSIDIPYEYSYGSSSSYGSAGRISSRTASAVENLRWSEIFIAIADDLMVPHTDAQIGFSLRRYLEHKLNKNLKNFSIDKQIRVKIKRHLQALRLINVYVGRTVQGTSAEFLQTTKAGEKELIERMVHRLPSQ